MSKKYNVIYWWTNKDGTVSDEQIHSSYNSKIDAWRVADRLRDQGKEQEIEIESTVEEEIVEN
jgi:hypothetical protein